MIDASAYFLYQGWFGDITLYVVVAYSLPSIRLTPRAELRLQSWVFNLGSREYKLTSITCSNRFAKVNNDKPKSHLC
jgi:hypothetical protein